MSNWPPTNTDTLHMIAAADMAWFPGPRGGGESSGTVGIAVFAPEFIGPLDDAGLIEPVPGMRSARRLTDKGREAVQMLNGHRKDSSYSMPDWVLEALTK